MKYVYIAGIVRDESDVAGGIFDTQKADMNSDEITLMSLISKHLARPEYGVQYYDGYLNNIRYEPFPFTGTIDDEIIIYFE